jgi:hypothetical protein
MVVNNSLRFAYSWGHRPKIVLYSKKNKVFFSLKILKFFDADLDPGSFDLDPGSFDLDPGWKNSDTGSGINIPDPQPSFLA